MTQAPRVEPKYTNGLALFVLLPSGQFSSLVMCRRPPIRVTASPTLRSTVRSALDIHGREQPCYELLSSIAPVGFEMPRISPPRARLQTRRERHFWTNRDLENGCWSLCHSTPTTSIHILEPTAHPPETAPGRISPFLMANSTPEWSLSDSKVCAWGRQAGASPILTTNRLTNGTHLFGNQ